jgi:pantoate--beta-alanine ligase
VITTVFVNPIQFGPGEDFERYPRTLEADLELCGRHGADLVFAPPADEMYAQGQPAMCVDPGPIGGILEGASRPGHFGGVLTVVLKLLNLTQADLAFFGEKDFQQLAAIRAMVAAFDLPVRIVGVPTVREADGLAMSSRNRYLGVDERRAALALRAALAAGTEAAGLGTRAVIRAALRELAGRPMVAVDYVALTDGLLRPLVEDATGPARLLVAARVGTTRLIDNTAVEVG